MSNFFPGAVATIALWKSAPMLSQHVSYPNVPNHNSEMLQIYMATWYSMFYMHISPDHDREIGASYTCAAACMVNYITILQLYGPYIST